MSSTPGSSPSPHARSALATTAHAASWASPPSLVALNTASIASSFFNASKTPSVPTTTHPLRPRRNSVVTSSTTVVSGSDTTPMSRAIAYPMPRVNAHPGYASSPVLAQRRGGSSGSTEPSSLPTEASSSSSSSSSVSVSSAAFVGLTPSS
eukprot:30096-Pelagococcus_subviridis.AAC.5